MRIISRDRSIDMPYESSIIFLDEQFLDRFAIFATHFDDTFCMATYSTLEKAKKVMKMMRDKYSKYLSCQGGQLATIDSYVQPYAYTPPKVFEFPSDEEV